MKGGRKEGKGKLGGFAPLPLGGIDIPGQRMRVNDVGHWLDLTTERESPVPAYLLILLWD